MGQFAFVTFTSILFLVDPIAVVPAYLAFVRSESPERRKATARAACVAAGITLLVFASAGDLILKMFGVTLPAFRIAGGFILWLVAMDMLRAQPSRQRTSPEEEAEGVEKVDVSVFPLAIPMLAGPGAISTVVLLVSNAKRIGEYLVVFVAIALTAFATYSILVGALRIERRLGRVGLNVLQRVMGLILAAIAVQFVADGARDLLPAVLEPSGTPQLPAGPGG